jgi:hypothetical protein
MAVEAEPEPGGFEKWYSRSQCIHARNDVIT